MSLKYVSVLGYGWTGSGVVVDLLREFDDYAGLNLEFSMVWEPNGLLDLEKALVDDWDFLRHDTAIRDFISYCNILNRKGGKMNSWGLDLSNQLGVDFIYETKNYIDKLVDFTYKGHTRLFDYKLSAFKLFTKRVVRKLFKNYVFGTDMYMARPSKDKFLKETKNYLDNLFRNYAKKHDVNNIILDQSIPASNIIKTMNYFNDIKSIVVDRDPRDVYVNLIKRKALIGAECSLSANKNGVKKFVQWHKILREQDTQEQDKDKILRLRFEEIILNYDDSIENIIDFLDIKTKHSQKNLYFKPQVSRKKIGLWESYKNQEEIDFIYDELREYCYE